MNICYYCGAEASSDEHVPPRAIFPKKKDTPNGKDYRNELITVRSCPKHNTEKSLEDEYLLYVLAMSLPSNEVAKHQFLSKVMRAAQRQPKLLTRLTADTQEVVVHDTLAGTWQKTIAIRPEESRLIAIFTSIAKGLYFHERGAPWPGKVSVLIEFMLSFDDVAKNERQHQIVQQLESMLDNVPLKGNNPDVFGYRFVEVEGKAMARLHFYGNSKVSVVFVE